MSSLERRYSGVFSVLRVLVNPAREEGRLPLLSFDHMRARENVAAGRGAPELLVSGGWGRAKSKRSMPTVQAVMRRPNVEWAGQLLYRSRRASLVDAGQSDIRFAEFADIEAKQRKAASPGSA